MSSFKLSTFPLAKYHKLLRRGLSKGMGYSDGQMCIEAVICHVLNLGHDDEPDCVSSGVRDFKIGLNDASWSSPHTRAKGMYNLGLAQLGSRGKVNGRKFNALLTSKLCKKMLPALVDEFFGYLPPHREAFFEAVERCSKNPSKKAKQAVEKTRPRTPIDLRSNKSQLASTAIYWLLNGSFYSTANWARKASADDKYLIMMADIALEVLRELKSPGCRLIAKAKKLK